MANKLRLLDAEIHVAAFGNCRVPEMQEYDGEEITAGSVLMTKGFVGTAIDSPKYTTSMDAAKTLIPPEHRECWIAGYTLNAGATASVGLELPQQADTPEMALCKAALKSRGIDINSLTWRNRNGR